MSNIPEIDKKEIRKLLQKGAQPEAILLAYDYSLAEIQSLNTSRKRLDPATARTIFDRAVAGATHAHLATEFGVHVNTVQRLASGKTKIPTTSENASLTPSQIAALRTRRRAGESLRLLAREMSVTTETAIVAAMGYLPWSTPTEPLPVENVAPLTAAELSALVARWCPAEASSVRENGATGAAAVRRALAGLCMRADSPYWLHNSKIYFI